MVFSDVNIGTHCGVFGKNIPYDQEPKTMRLKELAFLPFVQSNYHSL